MVARGWVLIGLFGLLVLGAAFVPADTPVRFQDYQPLSMSHVDWYWIAATVVGGVVAAFSLTPRRWWALVVVAGLAVAGIFLQPGPYALAALLAAVALNNRDIAVGVAAVVLAAVRFFTRPDSSSGMTFISRDEFTTGHGPLIPGIAVLVVAVITLLWRVGTGGSPRRSG
ncbi:hypothetical protein [Actinokineospora inagensis]|uniref:hypothetical protein n=1 Tax=Actinokineospora inagensis TaxID=103730 RepID=UPI00055010CE|nr:hypothetical protein [Actinokineospora inagensis]